MNKFDLIYNSEYILAIDVYYHNSPKCKIKIHYSFIPNDNYTLLEESNNTSTTKYLAYNLSKSYFLNDMELFNVEVLKNNHIIDYKHETISKYNLKTDMSNIIILHEFKLASYEILRIIFKFDIKHVNNK